MDKVSENPLKNRRESVKPLMVVTALFVTLYLVSNIMAVKVISIAGWFYFDAGTITFPFAYMLGDVLTEIWGYRTAKKIISYREANGPFSKVEDIMNVPGIKEARFLAIKEDICVG